MDISNPSPTSSIPSDEDSPYEVRAWIISVLLCEPAICSDEEAEALAGKFHGCGLDLKTASCGDLQSASCLGPRAGLRVFERVDGSQGTVWSPRIASWMVLTIVSSRACSTR